VTTKSYVPVRAPPASAISTPVTEIAAALPVNVMFFVARVVPLNVTVIVVFTGFPALRVPCFT